MAKWNRSTFPAALLVAWLGYWLLGSLAPAWPAWWVALGVAYFLASSLLIFHERWKQGGESPGEPEGAGETED